MTGIADNLADKHREKRGNKMGIFQKIFQQFPIFVMLTGGGEYRKILAWAQGSFLEQSSYCFRQIWQQKKRFGGGGKGKKCAILQKKTLKRGKPFKKGATWQLWTER